MAHEATRTELGVFGVESVNGTRPPLYHIRCQARPIAALLHQLSGAFHPLVSMLLVHCVSTS